VVFFVVLTSVLVQGSTIPFVARRLGLEMPLECPAKVPEKLQDKDSWDALVMLPVSPGSPAVGKQIADLNIPEDTWIAVLRRDGHPMRPSGSTVLKAGAPPNRPVQRKISGAAQGIDREERGFKSFASVG